MQSTIMNLLSELRTDALSGKISPAVSVGVISGLVVLVRGISWGVIVFSGPLAPYSSQGTSVVLFGSLAVCLVVALTGSYRGTISALPAPCVVMLVAISSTLDAASDALFMSMVATLMLSALAAGVGFLLIGRFRLADLTRFIPYPVAGGFLAGTGGALGLAALALMGISLDRQPLSDLLNLAVVWNWGPGVAYGLGLFLATARWKSFWILPVSFVLAAVSYHLSLPLLGISGDEARAAGLLFEDTAEGALWPAFGLGDVARVDWTAVAGQIPNMLALILVTLLCLVTGVGRPGIGRQPGAGVEQGIQSCRAGQPRRRLGRWPARMPDYVKHRTQPPVRSRNTADRPRRCRRRGRRPALRPGGAATGTGAAVGRGLALHRPAHDG